MLKSKKENKLKWTVLIVCCLSSIFEQWTRTMFPFSLWGLKPRPEFSVALMINAINGIATLIGTFFVANIIDTLGTRTTAIISVIVVSIFQLGYSWITNYYFFGIFQLLMLFNHMPTVVDATIAQLANEIADVKQKARLMSQTAIPTSIAFAIGPLIAVQLFYTFSPSIHWIQSICGIFHIITVLPIIFFLFPKNQEFSSEKGANIFNMFGDILKKPGNKETLLFILLISGTWNSYDQAIRLHLTGQMLTSPFKMAILALLLGSASLISNFVLLPILQRKITTKRIVQLSLVIMTICYFYLTRVTDYEEIIIGMPFQVVGVCLALGPLTAQILGSVPASHAGKSAALNRIAQISATALAPLITGAYTDQDEAYILCWVNIGICVITFVLIELYGNFMGKCTTNLPWCMSQASMDRFE